jgi:hypothetical protein
MDDFRMGCSSLAKRPALRTSTRLFQGLICRQVGSRAHLQFLSQSCPPIRLSNKQWQRYDRSLSDQQVDDGCLHAMSDSSENTSSPVNQTPSLVSFSMMLRSLLFASCCLILWPEGGSMRVRSRNVRRLRYSALAFTYRKFAVLFRTCQVTSRALPIERGLVSTCR